MSGDDMVKKNIAKKKRGSYKVGAGVLEASQALKLLKELKKKYPYHSIELPAQRVTALEK